MQVCVTFKCGYTIKVRTPYHIIKRLKGELSVT